MPGFILNAGRREGRWRKMPTRKLPLNLANHDYPLECQRQEKIAREAKNKIGARLPLCLGKKEKQYDYIHPVRQKENNGKGGIAPVGWLKKLCADEAKRGEEKVVGTA